jgi:murein DD-endopeptidase MepM/ murein hydrolase activator NlpD
MNKKKKSVKTYTVAIIPEDGSTTRSFSGITTNQLMLGSVAVAVGVAIVASLLIVFTPIRQLIPGYGLSHQYEQAFLENQARLDSLTNQMLILDDYNRRMKKILGIESLSSGKGQPDKSSDVQNAASVSSAAKSFSMTSPVAGLGFQLQDTSATAENLSAGVVAKGRITQPFNPKQSHFGIDIALTEGSSVSSLADGVVVFSGWTYSYGYMIIIDHLNGYTSFYKHNKLLLKTDNEFVKKGESIALSGNTGQETSAPHLHFEIWKGGVPENPELYLIGL